MFVALPGMRAGLRVAGVDPLLSPSGPVTNLDGAVIQDSNGNVGIPGYDGMTGPNALACTLGMQTHGVPVPRIRACAPDRPIR